MVLLNYIWDSLLHFYPTILLRRLFIASETSQSRNSKLIYMDGLIRFLEQIKSSEIPIVKQQLFSFKSPHHYWLAPLSCRTRLDVPGNPLATEIHESPASHRFSDRFTQAGNRTPALVLQIHQQPAG